MLKKNSKKISDFIKDTYLPKEQKNKFAQISKILNPKKDAPKYYTENDLAFDLSHWFNSFSNGDVLVSPEYFVGNNVEIPVVGSLYGNGQVGLHKGKEITKINIHPKYANCHAIESQIGSSRGYMRLFVPSKSISHAANNRFGFAQDKKSKIAFSVHDEVVIDVTDDEKKYIPEIIELFSNNKLGKFSATVKAGRDFGNLKRLNL